MLWTGFMFKLEWTVFFFKKRKNYFIYMALYVHIYSVPTGHGIMRGHKKHQCWF